jgi:hypothetical protein
MFGQNYPQSEAGHIPLFHGGCSPVPVATRSTLHRVLRFYHEARWQSVCPSNAGTAFRSNWIDVKISRSSRK